MSTDVTATGSVKEPRPWNPQSKLGWWAFGLACATWIWGIGLFGMASIATAIVGRNPNLRVPIPVGFSGAAIELLIIIATLVVAIVAIRRGERSKLTLIAFVPAGVVGGFWLLFILGEFLFPH